MMSQERYTTGLGFRTVILVLTMPARFHVADCPILTPSCQSVSHGQSAAFLPPACKVEYLLTKEIKIKGKAIPLQAWTGPEGSRRLRLPDFKTIDT